MDWRLGAALGIALLARLPSFWEPRWSHDEGVFSAVGRQVLAGTPLYRGVWDLQQPLVYLWSAAVLVLTHGWHPGMQMLLAAQVAAAAAGVYLISARLGGRPFQTSVLFGVVAALPITEGNLQTAEMVGLPLLLAGFWLGAGGGPGRAVAAGALVVLAGLAQPAYLLQGIALAWYVTISGKPLRLLPMAAGAAGAGLGAAALLGLSGIWPAYSGVLGDQRGYLAWANGGAELAPIAVLIRVIPIAVGLFAGLAIGLEQRTPAARLLGPWLPLAVLGAVISPRGFMHYGLEVLAPLCLLLGLWLEWKLILPVAAGLVLAIQMMLFLPRLEMAMLGVWPAPTVSYATFGWTRLPGYYRGWYDRALGIADWEAYAAVFPGDPAAVEREAAALKVEGGLAVWGDVPWLYTISGRRPPGRYVSHDSAWRLQPGAAQREVAAITSERPEYVVVAGASDRRLDQELRKDYDLLKFVRSGTFKTYGLHSG